MAAQDNKLFGNAVFGGFNRQDVLSYIEFTSAEFAQTVKKCNSEIEQLKSQKNELRTKVEELNNEIANLNAQLSSKSGEDQKSSEILNGLTYENARLVDENVKYKDMVSEISSEAEALRAEVTSLKENEKSIDSIKLHLADIEISAYQRADQIAKEAELSKEKAISEIASIIVKVKSEFEDMKSSIEYAASDVTGQIDKINEAISSLPSFFDSAIEQFDAVFGPSGSFSQSEPSSSKMLSPLPLDEEETPSLEVTEVEDDSEEDGDPESGYGEIETPVSEDTSDEPDPLAAGTLNFYD